MSKPHAVLHPRRAGRKSSRPIRKTDLQRGASSRRLRVQSLRADEDGARASTALWAAVGSAVRDPRGRRHVARLPVVPYAAARFATQPDRLPGGLRPRHHIASRTNEVPSLRLSRPYLRRCSRGAPHGEPTWRLSIAPDHLAKRWAARLSPLGPSPFAWHLITSPRARRATSRRLQRA